MKIGIMGGTFNPIHLAHINLAKKAYEQYQLDRIIFIPTGDPPHKKGQNIVPGYHRYNMVKLAIKDYSQFDISDIEINNKGYSYSYETLSKLAMLYPKDELYFIIGGDSLVNFFQWFNPEGITKLCTIIAANRNNMTKDEFNKHIIGVEEAFNCKILPLDTDMMQISSSAIRKYIMEGKVNPDFDITLLDQRVLKYINDNKLYQI